MPLRLEKVEKKDSQTEEIDVQGVKRKGLGGRMYVLREYRCAYFVNQCYLKVSYGSYLHVPKYAAKNDWRLENSMDI